VEAHPHSFKQVPIKKVMPTMNVSDFAELKPVYIAVDEITEGVELNFGGIYYQVVSVSQYTRNFRLVVLRPIINENCVSRLETTAILHNDMVLRIKD